VKENLRRPFLTFFPGRGCGGVFCGNEYLEGGTYVERIVPHPAFTRKKLRLLIISSVKKRRRLFPPARDKGKKTSFRKKKRRAGCMKSLEIEADDLVD